MKKESIVFNRDKCKVLHLKKKKSKYTGSETVMAAFTKGHKGCNKPEKHMNHPHHAVVNMENISLGCRIRNKA